MIIDAHVYCLPERLRAIPSGLPDTESAVLDALHRHPEGARALALSAPDAILRSMDGCGVDRSVLVAMPWTDPSLCSETNEYLLGLAAREPRFSVIAAAQPGRPGWEREAEKCLAAGAVGIKVNPAWQGFELDGPEMDALAGALAGRGFIMCHIDQPFKHSRSSPAHLYRLAPRHPRTRFLAAHMGGLLGLYHLRPENRPALANIWYDTAVSQTLKMVEFYAAAGLSERVVFGTDFPFNHCHDQGSVLEGLRGLTLSRAELDGILSANMLALLGNA